LPNEFSFSSQEFSNVIFRVERPIATKRSKKALSKLKEFVKNAKNAPKKSQTSVKLPCDYVCEFCGQLFARPASLGGHKAKTHPGQSSKYAVKMLIRDEKEIEREYRQKVKELIADKTQMDPKDCRF
jgi:hypothetical protein